MTWTGEMGIRMNTLNTCLVALASAALARVSLPPQEQTAAIGEFESIRTKSIEVVSDDGTVRAVLAYFGPHSPHPGPQLIVYGSEGMVDQVVRIGAEPGGSSISLTGSTSQQDSEHPSVHILAVPWGAFVGAHGFDESSALLSATKESTGLRISRESAGIGLKIDSANALLKLSGPSKAEGSSVFASTPLDEKETARIGLQNNAGAPVVFMKSEQSGEGSIGVYDSAGKGKVLRP